MRNWNKGELFGLLSFIVAVVTLMASLMIPELRCKLFKKDCQIIEQVNASATSKEKKKVTVHVQIFKDDQQVSATQLRNVLNSSGMSAGEVEKVKIDAYSPKELTIRYFYDNDLKSVKLVKGIISKQLDTNVALQPLLNFPDKEPPGTIEIWYSSK